MVPVVTGNTPRAAFTDALRASWLENPSHKSSLSDVRRDAVNWQRCRATKYRVSHYGLCPSAAAYRAKGIRVSDRLPGVQRQADSGAAVVGAWTGLAHIPSLAIHAALLPTGKVMLFAYPNTNKNDASNFAQAFLWDPVADPAAAHVQEIDPPGDPANGGRPFNIWCAGLTFLANGDLVVAGGTKAYPGGPGGPATFLGSSALLTFNPFTEKWTVQPQMSVGRWYPSLARLPDGRVLIVGGGDGVTGAKTNVTEVFTPSADPSGVGTVDPLPIANIITSLYPHLFLIPGGTGDAGEVLMAGPDYGDSHLLDLGQLTGPTAKSWINPDFLPKTTDQSRRYGDAVLMPFGPGGPRQVMLIGGYNDNQNDTPIAQQTSATGDGTNQTAVLNFAKNSYAKSYTAGPTMNCWPIPDPDPNPNVPHCTAPGGGKGVGRVFANSVILPDGSLVSVGGGRGAAPTTPGSDAEASLYTDPIYAAEILPAGGTQWLAGPLQQDQRTYHSTGLLLPNGSVLSTGDDRLPGNSPTLPGNHQPVANRTAEIYSPPYMFRGPHPTMTRAPSGVTYNFNFSIDTPDAANIASVVLTAPGAVTHGLDMNQRSIQLNFQRGAGTLTATSPLDETYAPPGYYMLWVVNSQGVPSLAAWVRLDRSIPGVIYQTITPPPAAAPGPTPVPITAPHPAGGGAPTAKAAPLIGKLRYAWLGNLLSLRLNLVPNVVGKVQLKLYRPVKVQVALAKATKKVIRIPLVPVASLSARPHGRTLTASIRLRKLGTWRPRPTTLTLTATARLKGGKAAASTRTLRVPRAKH
jgi:hypothetical protein